MKDRKDVDAELHTIRSAARGAADPATRHQIETARFNLFAAFETHSAGEAARWCRALRASLLGAEFDDVRLRHMALDALDVIETALGENHREAP